MGKKFLALSLAAILALPTTILADTSVEIAPTFPSMFAASGIAYEPTAPISRARFSMLTLEAFRTINNSVFPSMEAKNIFTDIGQCTGRYICCNALRHGHCKRRWKYHFCTT